MNRAQTYQDRILVKLSRITTTGNFIPELDGLRFLAIMWVVLLHIHHLVSPAKVTDPKGLWGVVSVFIQSGSLGVNLFFVISGFILAYPFAKQHFGLGREVDLKQYYWRRVTRLEPPYIVAMTAFYAAAAFATSHSLDVLMRHGTASVFYLHSLTFDSRSLINSPAWSLEVEVQFYILAPLLAQIFQLNAIARRLLMIALIGGATFAQRSFGLSYLTLAGEIQYFIAGYLLCDLYLCDHVVRNRGLARYDLGFVAGLPILAIMYNDDRLTPWIPFVVLAMYVAVFRGVAVRDFFRTPWIYTIGGMCYSIYLIHAPIIAIMGRFTSKFIPYSDGCAYLLQLLLLLPAILVLSSLFFIALEKPCMDRNWPEKARTRIRRILGGKLE